MVRATVWAVLGGVMLGGVLSIGSCAGTEFAAAPTMFDVHLPVLGECECAQLRLFAPDDSRSPVAARSASLVVPRWCSGCPPQPSDGMQPRTSVTDNSRLATFLALFPRGGWGFALPGNRGSSHQGRRCQQSAQQSDGVDRNRLRNHAQVPRSGCTACNCCTPEGGGMRDYTGHPTSHRSLTVVSGLTPAAKPRYPDKSIT